MQMTNTKELRQRNNTEEFVPKPNRMLRVSCYLLNIFAVISFIITVIILIEFTLFDSVHLQELTKQTGIIYDTESIATMVSFELIVSFMVAILSYLSGRDGLRLLDSKNSNTYKEVANCQAFIIGDVGLTLISTVMIALLLGYTHLIDLFPFVIFLALPIAYYRGVSREKRTGFWRGIKKPEIKAREIPSMDQLNRAYYISEVDGMLYPAENFDDADVQILSLSEFLEVNGESPIAQHIERSFESVHHCAANTYGEFLYGAIVIPVEEFDATDGSYDHDIAFVWLLTRDHMYFITDDPEDVMLLERAFADQSLRKSNCAAVLFEVLYYVIRNDNNYLIDLERRLDQLEDKMSSDVNEIPQDFSEYVAQTRTDLCAVEGFYKQLADMAEDIETSPAFILSKEARELYSSLDNKATRLANDTHMMREYILQIRSIYQEKINVKQNNVISVLTIVTSIFMPLTLLTGWYGMNFENMPELHQPYAYFAMIILAVLIVTIEVVFFKKKRWF